MRRIQAFILLLIVITPGYSFSQKIINATQYNISAFTFKCCNDLDIDSCLIMISPSDDLFKFGIKGHSSEIDKGNSYHISISRYMSFEETEKAIAHELVHIKQMKSGILSFDRDSIKYRNKKYPNKREKHMHDEHEIEAVYTGERLYQKFNKELYIL